MQCIVGTDKIELQALFLMWLLKTPLNTVHYKSETLLECLLYLIPSYGTNSMPIITKKNTTGMSARRQYSASLDYLV